MFEQDYIMRQIHMLVQAIARIFFGRQEVSAALPGNSLHYTKDDQWHHSILELVDQGRINDGENLLFDGLEPGNRKHLLIALDFYQQLNAMDDAALLKGGFSRDEILQGLGDVAKAYGINLSGL